MNDKKYYFALSAVVGVIFGGMIATAAISLI